MRRSGHRGLSDKGTAGSEFGEQVVHGIVNIPLSSNSALRVALSLDDYKGIEHNSSDGTDSKDDTYALRARYLWQTSDPLTINLIADVQRQVYHGPGYGPLPGFIYVYARIPRSPPSSQAAVSRQDSTTRTAVRPIRRRAVTPTTASPADPTIRLSARPRSPRSRRTDATNRAPTRRTFRPSRRRFLRSGRPVH